jgi:hypothetical protein
MGEWEGLPFNSYHDNLVYYFSSYNKGVNCHEVEYEFRLIAEGP